MDYNSTVNWMFQQLPMYQNKGKTAYKADLSNTYKLAAYLKYPEKGFRSIHVGGTNGKGSTSHILASILQEAGYKVGLYTSPHLKDFRERIRINGKPISKQFVMGFIKKHKAFFEKESLSFFEMTVGMAFDYFRNQQVDIAVIEVGLGGRLDSTNIISPEVSVITNIGFDHMQFLGNTMEAIAKEKAGIIKPHTPVVIGERQQDTVAVFQTVAESQDAPIYFAEDVKTKTYTSDLIGDYQQQNIQTALVAIQQLQDKGYSISEQHIKTGLQRVTANTGLRGRWEVLQEHPKVICDTAHNKEGLSYIVKQLERESYEQLHIVFGAVNDKDLSSILSLLPKTATYYFCKPNIARGMAAETLQQQAQAEGLEGKVYSSVVEALEAAKTAATKSDLIYVGGSTFVVAEII